jgi:shikimate 5-dehydrogenase
VVWALHSEGAAITLLARKPGKAKELAEGYGAEWKPISDRPFDEFDVVINATPVGMRGEHEDKTAATAAQLRGVQLAYDLVYNPTETRFLREARQAGCDTLSGIEMLLSQAAAQFRLWIGREPDAQAMRTAVLRGFERASALLQK